MISKFIFEATTEYDNPPVEIGLMTQREFLHHRNESDKHHNSENWDSTIADLNNTYYSVRKIWLGRVTYLLRVYGGGEAILVYSDLHGKNKLIACIKDGVCQYTRHDKNFIANFIERGKLNYTQDDDIILQANSAKEVKYIDYTPPNTNLEGYSVIQQMRIGGAPFKLMKNAENDIKLVNEEGLIVATAQDEWGATLIIVAKEYRGAGLGKVVGKAFYKLNPDNPSGGFTPAGQRNAIAIWADRVGEMLANGWYSDMVKNGKITKDRVMDILSSLPERTKKEIRNLSKTKKKYDPLMLVNDLSFTIYDRKFFEDQTEDYIYAHGFVRDDSADRPYVFRLEYDAAFKNLATMTILQLAKDEGIQLYNEAGGADLLELDDIEGVRVNNEGWIEQDNDLLNVKGFAAQERKFRGQNDPYREIYYQIAELADTKWD